MARYNLNDIGFKDFDSEEKRYSFMVLDQRMKMLHNENKMVTSFEPSDIYYEDGTFTFSKVSDISPVVSDDKNSAILHNIIGLSDLAFCSYLPEYDLSKGLLHPLAISNKFESFIPIFNDVDKGYYYSIFVDAYRNNRLPSIPYYYDYVNEKEKQDTSKGVSNSLVKATQAGRLMSEKDGEAAHTNIFLLVTVVACLLLEFVGVVLYYINK